MYSRHNVIIRIYKLSFKLNLMEKYIIQMGPKLSLCMSIPTVNRYYVRFVISLQNR